MAQSEHRPTERVVDILELLAFSEKDQGMSLTEIARSLECPKSSISPILHTLARRKYLGYDPALQKYSVGRRVFEVGATYKEMDDFYDRALSEMRRIVGSCLESCHLAELKGSDVLYLMKVDSPEPIRMFSAPGKRLPANATALGKALLSRSSRERLEALFPNGLIRVTKNTVTDMDLFLSQLEEVRASGLAYEKEENSEFIQCIAVPLLKDDQPVLALSVSIPTFRYSDEKGRLVEQLLLQSKRELELLLHLDTTFPISV